MTVFQTTAGTAFRAENFGLDSAGVFSKATFFYYQVSSHPPGVTQLYLSFADPISFAYTANIISILGFPLDHSTFDDTFDTPYYFNSELHSYRNITSDFAFYDYASGSEVLIGMLTGSVYDIDILDSYQRIRTEEDATHHINTVEAFTGLFMGDDQVTLGALADYFCDPQGSLDLKMGGGDDLGIHMPGNVGDIVTIRGEAGNDRIEAVGGSGALYGGSGRDTLVATSEGHYDIYCGVGGDAVYGHHVTIHDGAGSGNDSYSADGTGRAYLTYETATRGIVADLWNGFAQSREVGNDTVLGIRQLRGGQGDDQLMGNPVGVLSEFGVTIWGDTGNDSVTGTSQADLLFGDAGNDKLSGYDGSDRLNGGAGNDRLVGSGGDDTLLGGSGRDILTGDAGADRFQFYAVTDSTLTASDRITDFTLGQDLIDLKRVDARGGGADNAFAFIGTEGFTAAGQLRMFQSGGDTVIEANTSGTGGAELRLVLTGLWALTGADFLL